ncbi:hypothetical protein Har1129_20170, partial [Haloarcula sp. CBA1129]
MTTSLSHEPETPIFTTHIHNPEYLLTFAARSTTQTDLIVTPVQFHQRNLTHRLAAQNQPRSSMRFVSPGQIAREVLEATDGETKALDRLDRIRSLETLLETEPGTFDAFTPLYGSHLTSHAADIESSRRAVGAITAYDDERLAILKESLTDLQPYVRQDAVDRIDGAIATNRRLDTVTDVAVSTDSVLRKATTMLRENGADIWNTVYPAIERIHLAGVSSIEAPLLDLLSCIATETPVDVHLFLRAGTGPRIEDRLCGHPPTAVQSYQSSPVEIDAPELVTTTRSQEARLALALVDQLRSTGVSPSDILLVARDVAAYEHELQRAAHHYGQSLSVWTQLSVRETIPYALIESLCTLLAQKNEHIPASALLRPLACEWVSPDASGHSVAPRMLTALEGELHGYDPLTLAEWQQTLTQNTEISGTASVTSLLEWISECPQPPTPADVEETFNPLIEAFRARVLPAHRDRDTDTLAETTETARALVRIEEMVPQVATKYEEWLTRDHSEQSWEEVQYLFETIARIKPGRREHANAAVIDVADATDTWLRRVPYVIAIGLVDGEWPQTADGLFPAEVRETILAGESGPIRSLAPRERWTEAREYDHFVDAVSTATEQVICTRHHRDADGVSRPRSPFLDAIETTRVDETATDRLLSSEQTTPPALATVLPTETS